jgi:uncharacterized membrane protein (DUF106 family)
MISHELKKKILVGGLFGAWVGGVYALVSQGINQIFMPSIPLTAPAGGFAWYLTQYMLLGILLGVISALPEARMAGVVLGGLVSTVLLSFFSLTEAWDRGIFSSAFLLMMCAFMPMIILLTPIAWLIRTGVDAQYIPLAQPNLWARKFLIPVALTVVVVILGCLSLYTRDHRLAIQKVNEMILSGKTAASTNDLPQPLKEIPDYLQHARGAYTLTWSDRLDTFMGPRPVGAELTQFLVVARFNNGFSFACVFSNNRDTPNCAVY